MMCTAETVISILQIPLQLKLLHPWNRGIHGYIRSHVKGCLSVFLFSSSPHLFPHSSFEKKSLCHLKVSDSYDLVVQMRFAGNSFNNIDEDRLAIKYVWIINADHITSVVTAKTFEGGKCRVCVVQQLQRLQVEIFYRSIPSMTHLQSSEKPVTLTTQFYHSSPLLPYLTAGIKCALNVYCCRFYTIIPCRREMCDVLRCAENVQLWFHCVTAQWTMSDDFFLAFAVLRRCFWAVVFNKRTPGQYNYGKC